MTKTETFSIPWEDGEVEVTIRKMGWGEKQVFIEDMVETKVIGSRIDISPKLFACQRDAMLKCLVKAPFPINDKYIDKQLDEEIGDMIYERIDKLNGFDVTKKVKKQGRSESALSSEETSNTPEEQSQST